MESFTLQFQLFTLIFARIFATLSFAPVLGSQTVNYFHRVAITVLIALIVVPVAPRPDTLIDQLQQNYFLLILEQIFIGFLIGFSLTLLFAAFQLAGEFFSVQMGFGISEVFDPMSQISLPLMGTLKNLLALYVFFISDSHIWLIKAVIYSYETLPTFQNNFLIQGGLHAGILKFLSLLGSGMFLIALKLALPVMGTLLLVSIVLGMLSKAAPQMNILMLGFPMKIFIGLLILGWSAPFIIELTFLQFELFFSHMHDMLTAWSKAD